MHIVAEGYAQYAQRKGIDLVFSPVQNTIVMDFIPDYIHKTIHNLISNSLKFTPKGGHIYISTNVTNTHLIIRVADNGRGIDPADLPHIFQPFYQGENTNTSMGTGIGLSLVAQMVSTMNGTITVKSSPGKGAIFTIKLPLRHADNVPPIENPEKPSPFENLENLDTLDILHNIEKAEKPKDSSKPIVLIVEDNDSVAYYISSHISENYQVHYAHNGRDGLQKALELIPDVIVTDVMMPEMDGVELCRRVRADVKLSHIPIIIVTAKADDEEKVMGLEAGADAYLVKPFNLKELIVRIEGLIEQRRMLCEKYQRALHAGKIESDEMKAADRLFISHFVDIIYSLIAKNSPTDLETVAAALNMTSRTLSRKVMAITGDTPLLYINKVKVTKAKGMIDAEPAANISDIAYRCGFEDPNYFSRIFKQVEGVTPTAYRRRVK